MIHFPARKCYHVAKIAILLLLVVALLTILEQWRGGKRSAGAMFTDPLEAEFERQILEDEARVIPGLGDGGVAAHLTGKQKLLGEESEKKLAMNVYLSDRISYNRTLKDYRNPACSRVVYDAELPSASVILIFHNEPYSVVMRTVWSVINSARRDQPWYKQANFIDRDTGKTVHLGYPGQDPSSPLVYLKEIILVDDNSTLPELKGKLSHYARTRLPPDLIRILRLPDRVGLTRARLAGARYAVGDVLVFLDAHCEPQPDWLRPLLQPIKNKRETVAVPIIDVIDSSNFFYSVQDSVSFQVGGFTFAGHFTWVPVPEREKKRRGSDIAPTWSPTMAGGLFAINRAYYWELGAYDEQMAGWGGENLEMSFRIWQCGGTLETIPCSRVGHVFRSFHPYGLPAASDTHGINTARMAEVWMDEYAELFYLHRPDLRNNPKIGDITHRKVLREKLKCKSFQWYLDNIYKEKFVPVRDVYGYGRFMNPSSGKCLDTLQRESEGSPLGVYPCHSTLQATQYFSLALTGELRDEEKCAVLQYARKNKEEDGEEQSVRRVLLTTCGGSHKSQKWRHKPSGEIVHVQSGLCLDAGHESGDVVARACSTTAHQVWQIDFSEDNDFHNPVFNDPPDKAQRLHRLRGQRRISRSLLSFDETPEDNRVDPNPDPKLEQRVEKDKGRRHSRKRKHRKRGKKRSRSNKKKAKNKFILKLVRTLMNGTDEHLEVDIRCSHRKLHPNNTFVRDLVTIFNENNIKVINNGRVFERNKVTELAHEVDPQTKQRGEVKVLNKMDVQPPPPSNHEQTKHVKVKKQKRPLVEPLTEHPDPVGGAAAAPPPPIEEEDKRIIVEDFVEVKSTPTPEKNKRFKKRKRKRSKPTTAETPVLEMAPGRAREELEGKSLLQMLGGGRIPGLEEQVKAPALNSEEADKRPKSVEDTPMVGSAEGGGGSGPEDWPLGESRFRRHNTSRPLVRRLRHRYPPDRGESELGYPTDESLHKLTNRSEPRASGREGLPVKVVMRSNLTFNVGDEFFAWKKRNGDDIAELLNDLSSGREDPGGKESPDGREAPPSQGWEKASAAPPRDTNEDDSSSSSGSSNESS